jgi:hypothetical protein
MLLSSLIEFGFAINEYLDLIDTTRETARFLSDQDPFANPTTKSMDENFYLDGVDEMDTTIQRAGWITLDPSVDDLVITVFSVESAALPFTITRYPAEFSDTRCGGAQNGGNYGWRRYCKKSTKFTNQAVHDRIDSISSAPDTGIVLVEIYYDYHMKLGLPWVTGIVGDTITLHAYSFAPNAASEP